MPAFELSTAPLDAAQLAAPLEDIRAGACVQFEGRVRDHNEGRSVLRLDYEAFDALALAEGERILAEARARFAIIAARCVHRTGPLALGDVAIWIGVTAAHRAAAFEACRFILDEVKARVPIWKKEHYAEGDSGWINCAAPAAIQHTPDLPPQAR
jgi:molybdopterin synthase catalytic subunit